MMKTQSVIAGLLTALVFGPLTAHAATTVLRITKWEDDGIYPQYRDNPGTYPVTQEKLGLITFSGAPADCIRADGTRMFDTTLAAHETGRGDLVAPVSFTGDEVVSDIRRYENVGLTVDHVLVFREDWLKRNGPGGPYSEDIRILDPQELTNIRTAIANSNLQCKDTVKIIQLLGARVAGHRGDTWFDCIQNPALMAHLANFDGIGTECHVGDYDTANGEPDGPETLDAMAAITKWAQDNGKMAHVFMGGGATTYVANQKTRLTYEYLWDEMDLLGVDRDAEHLIYFRQGARPGKHIPESQNSITSQMKELIGHVYTPYGGGTGTGPTSGLVAHWPLDEGSGTQPGNAAGTVFKATMTNGAAWGSDTTRDSYVVFDGIDDRISTTFTYALHATNDFTWAWWAKTPGSHPNSIMVGNRYGNSGTENLEFIKMMPTKASFANTDSAASIENYDYVDIPSDEWHHYAMVKDGTQYQWYVDGVAQGSPVTLNYSETTPIPFLIGGDDDGSGTKVNEHFEGCIDDVVLYRSALTQGEVQNIINGIYLPVITMVDLGVPADSTAGSTWSDGQPAHSGAGYVVPATGNLRGESSNNLFPGASLTVEAGGKFQVRAKISDGDVATVNDLVLQGGASFNPGQFAELAAGTGTAETNVLDGTITQSGSTRLVTYASSINRSLLVLSQIDGDGTLQLVGEGAIIDYPENTFSGLWQVNDGATLQFSNAGAIGSADIELLDGGRLVISDDWNSGASLSAADTATTSVEVGSRIWAVATLEIGGVGVPDGAYTTSELNALGTNPVFSGSGIIYVGDLPPETLIAGWDTWNTGASPAPSVLATNITGSAATTTEQLSWNVTDERGASEDATWGTFAGPPVASVITNADFENLTLPNATTGGTITFTVSNNGADDIIVNSFHFDAYAFRPKAPRTFELSVLAGGGLSEGVIFSSEPDAITEVSGSWDNGAHDDIDIDFAGMADRILGAGESVELLLAFSEGVGDGSGGHHLFVDNVSLAGTVLAPASPTESPVLEHSMSGSDMVFNWTGSGFKVQTRTNLVVGSWHDVPGGDTPPVTVVPAGPEAYFRLIGP